MEMNRFSLPFLTGVFPYNSNGIRVPFLDPETDPESAENYRFTKLTDPPNNIDFLTPNSHHGARAVSGETDPDFQPKPELNLFQPHIWRFYWHMRPVSNAIYGTAIPSPWDRKGGSMADPVLNSMYSFPAKRRDGDNPSYQIPWHENMSNDWLWNGMIAFDARMGDDLDRTEYPVIDAMMVGTEVTAGATGVDPTFDYTDSEVERNEFYETDGERLDE